MSIIELRRRLTRTCYYFLESKIKSHSSEYPHVYASRFSFFVQTSRGLSARSLILISFNDEISYFQKPNLCCGDTTHGNSLRIVASLCIFLVARFKYDNLCGGRREHSRPVSRTNFSLDSTRVSCDTHDAERMELRCV